MRFACRGIIVEEGEGQRSRGQRKKLNSKAVVTKASVGPTVSSGAKAGGRSQYFRIVFKTGVRWPDLCNPVIE